MAHIRKRTRRWTDKAGKPRTTVTYLARWEDDEGTERAKSFPRKVEATDFVRGLTVAEATGSYVDPWAGDVTVRAYAETWLAGRLHLRETTRMLYRSHLDNHVLPALGGKRLGGVRRSDSQSLVVSLRETHAPSTVRLVYAVARSMFATAVDDGLIARNPCERVTLPRVDRVRATVVPHADVARLADKIAPRYRLAVWLAAAAGLREGECLGLRVEDVDFLRRRLEVVVQRQTIGGKAVEVPPKTATSVRTVPLDDVVLDELAAHLARWPAEPGQPIIRNRVGRAVQRSSFGDCWRAAVEAAGLPKGTRFHDLRHTYASTLIAANVNPKVVQARLGHATIAETMDTYGHLFPDSEEVGRGSLDAAYRPAPETGRGRATVH